MTDKVQSKLYFQGQQIIALEGKTRGADVKIMDRFFRHRKVPLPRKIFKTRISA